MEITTPWVGQTGEVRLLSKLLNQKVDTVCSRSSGGKTLKVQGLPVCKKAGELGRNATASNGWLASRLAYPTVINQRKQKGNRDSARTFTFLIHLFTPINARSQTPGADLGERVRWCQERRRKNVSLAANAAYGATLELPSHMFCFMTSPGTHSESSSTGRSLQNMTSPHL